MPIIHTLESHKSDLSDLKDNKYHRGNLPKFLRIGETLSLGRILVRGSCGNNIVDMVAPMPGEYLIMKPGKTAFYKTHYDELLQSLGITHILVAGVTTEVCSTSLNCWTIRKAIFYHPMVGLGTKKFCTINILAQFETTLLHIPLEMSAFALCSPDRKFSKNTFRELLAVAQM